MYGPGQFFVLWGHHLCVLFVLQMSVSSMAHLQNSTNQNPSAPYNLCNMNPNLLQQMVGGAVSQVGVAEPPK